MEVTKSKEPTQGAKEEPKPELDSAIIDELEISKPSRSGDAVVAMADLNGDGGWVAGGGGEGGYALAREFLTVPKPESLSFLSAAALPMCFLSAFASLYGTVQAGDTVYIPGGGGGVGHLAVQMATRVLGAGLVISSGSTLQSTALARQSGAHYVFDYKRDDIAAEISKLTGGRGADLVFDATYSEPGFVETARTVRQGGSWIVLRVGPGKTTRVVETESPVDSILAERGAKHINVNILRYFSEPATLDDEAKTFLQRGMTLAMEWAVQGLVVPHVGRTIDSTVEAINAGLRYLILGPNPWPQAIEERKSVPLSRADRKMSGRDRC
jgi:NADPH:quinone reductase-like Zn-dependent oxidoreductase